MASIRACCCVAGQIREVHEAGVQTSIVLGGGNIIRGMSAAAEGMDRAQADYMGMLASVINGMARQDALEREGVPVRLQSAPEIARAARSPTSAVRRKAIRHLEKGAVVIFCGQDGQSVLHDGHGRGPPGGEIRPISR